jgi:hypothetical protein
MADDNDDNMDMKEETKSTEPIVRDVSHVIRLDAKILLQSD